MPVAELPANVKTLRVSHDRTAVSVIDLEAACADAGASLSTLPFSLRVLLENAVRRGDVASANAIANRKHGEAISFLPSRILLQDLLGVPLMVDLTSMRSAAARHGVDPARINPTLPVDLVIDHSLVPVHTGDAAARSKNEHIEIERNAERFRFLNWCQKAFTDVRVVPPGKGIMHQINLEYLSSVYREDASTGLQVPDTVYGTDSHTPMVNGAGVLGWGVGGIEAEIAMLGRSTSFPVPEVVGIELTGKRRPGVTATDVVLTVTERLRELGVVGKFVEFTGAGLASMAVADRGTIANMAPEYGATCVFFPVDANTLSYLRLSGRSEEHVTRVMTCAAGQQLWRDEQTERDLVFDHKVTLNLDDIVPSIAGPSRPQDRISLQSAHTNIDESFSTTPEKRFPVEGSDYDLGDGDIVIAAITSCTNTSNPAVVIGAALLARNALARGLTTKPWIKKSFAPGSLVVAEYLKSAKLQRHLDSLGFNVVGFGCTTCNGGSGPIADPIREVIESNDLTCASVLSGNRNFAGRIHPYCRANYIMSPPLVVAYALVGSMRADIYSQPLGQDPDGNDVYLRDIWPDDAEVAHIAAGNISSSLFSRSYAGVFKGSTQWDDLGTPAGDTFSWDAKSDYLREAPFFGDMARQASFGKELRGLRPLVMLGDSITTDHISPSGTIIMDSAAGEYLAARGLSEPDFNTYGTRRGNHEIVIRSGFANNRLQNEIGEREGSYTRVMPEGTPMRIFDAAMAYQKREVGLVVIAGKEYGCGSSRDTAAKAVKLLGVRAVVAESYERIHRSNLVGMGILPLQFKPGEGRQTHRLRGDEVLDVEGLDAGLKQGAPVTLVIQRADGSVDRAALVTRLDTPDEVAYMEGGGVLPSVLRDLAAA